MDQQRFDYLTQQRNTPGALTYEQAQAYDAADSRHEFDQFKQGAAGAAPPDQPQSNIAVAGPIGGGQPAPSQGQGDAVLPPGQVPPPTPEAPTTTPNPLIPTQNSPYAQAQPHDFWKDVGLPEDPRYIGPHPVAARLLNAVDFSQAGREHNQGAANMVRTLGGMALNTPPAVAAQVSSDPQVQDFLHTATKVGEYVTPAMIPPAIAWGLIQRLIRGRR